MQFIQNHNSFWWHCVWFVIFSTHRCDSGLFMTCRSAFKSLLDGAWHSDSNITTSFYAFIVAIVLIWIIIFNDLSEFSQKVCGICKSAALFIMAPVIGYSVCVCVCSLVIDLKLGQLPNASLDSVIRLRDTGEIPQCTCGRTTIEPNNSDFNPIQPV